MKKKITVPLDLLTTIATANLTTYHYKLWLLFATEPLTQAQAAEKLGVKKQNINRHTSDLAKLGLITVDRIEGKNKFFTAVTALPKGDVQCKDQMTLFDNE